ncbi:MAG: hypothetical protein LQ343_001912 [Gyalolechia ehrenbergii]|nr:MAG: hypothetical protein LQ343_001912 [Gyalolechia ehrenbergii]
MAPKRKTHPSNPGDTHSKRARHDDEGGEGNAFSSSQGQVDPTYGQRGAFPGLDDTASDNDLFYGPARDGLEYLRMVRSEAKGVPNLLTAETPVKAEEEKGEQNVYQDYLQGHYDDGAYIAISHPPSGHHQQRRPHINDEDIDPQEACYISLLTRFHTISSILRSSAPSPPPSPSALETATALNAAPLKRWRITFLYTPPTTALLANLSQDAIITGITALEKYLDWKMLERGQFVGAWAWSLLARCREVGMMGSEEVGVVRDLGKKTRGMLRGLRAGLGGGGGGGGGGEDIHKPEGEGEEEGQSEDDAANADKIALDDRAGDGDISHLTSNPLQENSLENGIPANAQQTADPDDDIAKAKLRLLTTLQTPSPHLSSSPPPPPQDSTPDLPACASPASPSQSGEQQPPSSSAFPHKPNISPAHPPSGTQHPVTSNSPTSPQPAAWPPHATEQERGEQLPLTTRISATLDAIITIVGEEYRQRDLLAGRGVWD